MFWKIWNGEKDLYPVSGNLKFLKMQNINNILINIKQDEEPELDEKFRLEIYNISNVRVERIPLCFLIFYSFQGVMKKKFLEIFIYKNDNPFGYFYFKNNKVIVNETSSIINEFLT